MILRYGIFDTECNLLHQEVGALITDDDGRILTIAPVGPLEARHRAVTP